MLVSDLFLPSLFFIYLEQISCRAAGQVLFRPYRTLAFFLLHPWQAFSPKYLNRLWGILPQDLELVNQEKSKTPFSILASFLTIFVKSLWKTPWKCALKDGPQPSPAECLFIRHSLIPKKDHPLHLLVPQIKILKWHQPLITSKPTLAR